MPTGQVYEFGNFRIDALERLLLREGRTVRLTPKAFETLLALVENSGHVVKKDALMKRVWPDAFVEEVNLAQNVSVLRRVLHTNGEQYIETIPKVGYRLVVYARAVGERDSVRMPEQRIVEPISGTIRSLLVLPLTNLSGDSSQEYFVDGVTEILTTEVAKLTRAAPLRLISRTTARQYKNSARTLPAIARELKVDAVLEGAVIRSGDRVRITVQLIRAAYDEHIWAKSYDRTLVDALALQAQIARDIARHIKGHITQKAEDERSKWPVASLEAQDLYLQASSEWNTRRADNLRRARAMFQRAIDLEPLYAAAWAGLADTEYIMVANAIGVAPSESLSRAKAAAQRALELDDSLAAPHASLGILSWSYDWNWPAAERRYKRAIELNPNYATAHQYYALGLASRERYDEAIVEAQRAVELDPLSPVMANALEQVFYYARRYDDAIRVCRGATNPNFPWHHRVLGLALLARGHNQEALSELLQAHELGPEFIQSTVDLVSAYVRLGQRDAALALLRELDHRARKEYVLPSQFAHVYADLGDTNGAFECLNRAVEKQRTTQMMQLNVPEWDVLRGDPRFALMQKRIVHLSSARHHA